MFRNIKYFLLIFLFLLSVFFVWQNYFSNRSQISKLEKYFDTLFVLHYLDHEEFSESISSIFFDLKNESPDSGKVCKDYSDRFSKIDSHIQFSRNGKICGSLQLTCAMDKLKVLGSKNFLIIRPSLENVDFKSIDFAVKAAKSKTAVLDLRKNCGGETVKAFDFLSALLGKNKLINEEKIILDYVSPYERRFSIHGKLVYELAMKNEKSKLMKKKFEDAITQYEKIGSNYVQLVDTEIISTEGHFSDTVPFKKMVVVVDENCFSSCQLLVNHLRLYSNVFFVGEPFAQHRLTSVSGSFKLFNGNMEVRIPSVFYKLKKDFNHFEKGIFSPTVSLDEYKRSLNDSTFLDFF